MFGVDDRVGHFRFERVVDLAVFLAAADDGGELGRVRTAQRIVKADDTAAAAQIVVERGAVLRAQVSEFGFVYFLELLASLV
jgi:hypothetical protein